jgi:predicted metal-dependent hydrolase
MHILWGAERRLEITESVRPAVDNIGDSLRLHVRHGSTIAQRKLILERFYRRELEQRIRERLPLWESIVGERCHTWRVRKMISRWGSCNTRLRRITVALELVKLAPDRLDYLLCHELIHLIETGHNARFYAHMDRCMPEWRVIRTSMKGHSID